MADGSIKHCYIAIKDMINPQKGFEAIHIDYNTLLLKDEIKLYIDTAAMTDYPDVLTQSDAGLKIAKMSQTQYGVGRLATETEVLLAASTPEILTRPHDIWKFANDSLSVKDNLNTYVDPDTSLKYNKTIIKAINESLTTTVLKYGTPEEGDIETYIVKTIPATGKSHQLGDIIHDKIVIKQVATLPVSAKAYELYYLNTIDGTNFPGMYIYDTVNSVWVKASGSDAIVQCENLPTMGINEAVFYELINKDVVLFRYKLNPTAAASGYSCNKTGIHLDDGIVTQDFSWAGILSDWTNWYKVDQTGKIIDDNTNGNIYKISNNSVERLEYCYVFVDSTIYYYYNGSWIDLGARAIPQEFIDNLIIVD